MYLYMYVCMYVCIYIYIHELYSWRNSSQIPKDKVGCELSGLAANTYNKQTTTQQRANKQQQQVASARQQQRHNTHTHIQSTHTMNKVNSHIMNI